MTTALASLTAEHRAYLHGAAITDAVIDSSGVYSTPEGICFPWRDGTTEVIQFRPDVPIDPDMKYVWPKGKSPILNRIRETGDNGPVIIVEGTKQSLAVASWAAPTFSVYGMAGCYGWSKTDLSVFFDRDVYVLLDGDAKSNLNVYDAAAALADALDFQDARVRFLRLPVQGKDGADDWLSSATEDRRTALLNKLVSRASAKPADRKPTQRGSGDKTAQASARPESDGRPQVAVNLDRLAAITQITSALRDRCDGRTLFDYGGALTRLRGYTTVPLNRDAMYRLIAENVACFDYFPASGNKPEVFKEAWPDGPTVGAVMSGAEDFSRLDRVVRAPFVRPDGTVCTDAGYDPTTRTAVVLGEGLDRIDVPAEPTQEDAVKAAKFLMHEWLGDMPFPTDADRANALALVLTPFVRGSVPLAPAAVVTGLQMGSGKNLFVDCVSRMLVGTDTHPLQYHENNDDELRKTITTAYREGGSFLVFDEAHQIDSKAFARTLTAVTYVDRILGSSIMVAYPNLATWVAIGNQVQVHGDMSRRVYYVALHPKGANPQDRSADAFRHEDLRVWTAEHRSEIVSAALTVIRAWYAAGQPAYSRGRRMGSFEPWDKLMSGITHYAGVHGFLTDAVERRSESDHVTGYWTAHLAWLRETFGDDPFTTSDVQAKGIADRDFERPPGASLADPAGPDWTRNLGQTYARVQDRWFGNLQIHKEGVGHRKTVKWTVRVKPEDGPTPPDAEPLPLPVEDRNQEEETTVAQHSEPAPQVFIPRQADPDESVRRQREAVTGPIGFDLEGASADQLYTGGHEGPYVRLCGLVEEGTGGPYRDGTAIGPHAESLVESLDGAEEIYGHRIFEFDLPALALHNGADYDALADKAVDTIVLARLVDPPMAKGTPAGYYSLDKVAERLGVPGKTNNIKALAKKHAPEEIDGRKLTEAERVRIGFTRIPTDDPEYVEYLHGDLISTRAVMDKLRPHVDNYARREMRVVALQNRMTINGFRVDRELLAQRVEAEETRARDALRELHEEHGVPLHKEVSRGRGAGKTTVLEPVRSPLGTDKGKAALIAAFARVGAVHYPRTASGGIALGKEALGSERYANPQGIRVPGMAMHYSDNPAVLHLIDLIRQVTGASAKYAEIAKHVTGEGRVHARVGELQASGRWAMVQPSITNLGKRGGKVVQRAVFLPEEGHVLLAADFSQVDMRGVAGHCQDPEYMAMFAEGKDFHGEVARMMGCTRDEAKPLGHGYNYGMGAETMINREGHPRELVERFFEVMSRFVIKDQWTNRMRDLARTTGLLDNGFGRRMRCTPGKEYTQAPALMGQGAARDIMCEGLLRIVERAPEMRSMLRVVVHDEVVVSVPADRVEHYAGVLKDAMTFDFRGVPILADVSKPGTDWASCYASK